MKRRTCSHCGQLFDPYEVDADGTTKFCSDRCCFEGVRDERERLDDDGREYADPRDYRDGLE